MTIIPNVKIRYIYYYYLDYNNKIIIINNKIIFFIEYGIQNKWLCTEIQKKKSRLNFGSRVYPFDTNGGKK